MNAMGKREWANPSMVVLSRDAMALRLADKMLHGDMFEVCPGCGLIGDALRRRHAVDPLCDFQLYELFRGRA